jgi:hypothetical protein
MLEVRRMVFQPVATLAAIYQVIQSGRPSLVIFEENRSFIAF